MKSYINSNGKTLFNLRKLNKAIRSANDYEPPSPVIIGSELYITGIEALALIGRSGLPPDEKEKFRALVFSSIF